MIKKMAKILLPWFILAYLPNLSSNVISTVAGNFGASALASLSMGSMFLSMPISIFNMLSLMGLVISAILQEKGNAKGGLTVHITFTCISMGLMLTAYLACILFPNQLLMIYHPAPELFDTARSHLTATGLTVLLLMVPCLLVGQLMLKKPSLIVTLILAGVLLTMMWIFILLSYMMHWGLMGLGIAQGLQIVARSVLPFALIPMRSYWCTFGPEENIIPVAEAAEAAAE